MHERILFGILPADAVSQTSRGFVSESTSIIIVGGYQCKMNDGGRERGAVRLFQSNALEAHVM